MQSDQKHARAHKGLWFSIMIEGEEFIAFLSAEALRDHFHAANANGHRTAYRMNQEWINSVALHKFHTGSPRPIRLDAADFDEVCTKPHLRPH